MRQVALTTLVASILGCGTLLEITDPTPNGGADGGFDAPGDSGPPPPDCVTAAVFQAEQTFALDATRTAVGITVGKLVAGGGVDLAIAQGDRFEIMTGNGLGRFSSRGFVTAPAEGVVIADFDTDGDDDLVTWNSTQVVALLQEGGGFLSPQPLIGPFSSVQTVMTGFLDGAFVPDIIVKDSGGARRYFPRALAPGEFTRDANPIAGTGANDLLIAVKQIDDVEDDDVALISPSGDVKISLAASGDTHAAATTIASGARDRAVAVGRFKVSDPIDVGLDLIVGTASGGVLYLGSTGTFSEFPGRIQAITTGPIQVIDVNGDSREDLVLPTGIVYQCAPAMAPAGAFTQFEELDASGASLVADVTGDGKPDLLRVTGSTLRVQIQ